MMTKIVPITVDNLELLAKAGSQFGMPRSVGWFRRCLFDPTLDGLVTDSIRGHLSINEKGEVVGVQAYYYVPCYFKQERILGNTGCIRGVNHECGEELLCILDRNRETSQMGAVRFGNDIANKRSARICKLSGHLQEVPYRPRDHRVGIADVSAYPISLLRRFKAPVCIMNLVWLMLRPFSWMNRILQIVLPQDSRFKVKEYSTIHIDGLEEFWRRFLYANSGVVSSREPKRLSWLFEESIKHRKVHFAVARKNGQIEGYVLIREMVRKDWCKMFQIIDICAVGNDVSCLKVLAKASLSMAARAGGDRVLFYGHMPNQDQWLDCVFKVRREDDHPYFMFGSRFQEIKDSLLKNEGWFFGPFDGERCLGYGGYIDF